MEEDLEDLLIVQMEIVGRIDRFMENTLKSHKKDAVNSTLLDKRLQLLDQYWRQFEEKHRTIIKNPHSKALDYVRLDKYSDVEGLYIKHSVELCDWRTRLLPPPPSASPLGGTQIVAHTEQEPKLPTIQLPTFSGDLLRWESFRDQFCALVHGSHQLSKVKKFQYLKSCLAGDALKMLETTPVTEANYDGAWASLEKRYGNKRILSAEHMLRLVNCSPASKGSTADLKCLLDDFRQNKESLSALGKPIDQWDEWFYLLLVEKLDSNTRLSWEVSLTAPTEVPTFLSLETFLENRLHALASAHLNQSASSSKLRETTSRQQQTSFSKSAMPVKVEASTAKPKRKQSCLMCAGDHYLGFCAKYKQLSVPERKKLVQKAAACLCCLNKTHSTSDCSTASRCMVCGAKHHSTLHEDRIATPTTSATHSICAKRIVLLATAQVKLTSPQGHSILARALIDSGSESSFVSEWVVQTLRLRRRPVRVSLTGYQGRDVGTAHHEVQINLNSTVDASFSLELDALVSKTVTAATPSLPVIVGDWPHLLGLTLADPNFSTPSKVDLLLGVDACGHLFQEKRTGPPGSPYAINTPLGWVLFGSVSSAEPDDSTRQTCSLTVSCRDSLDDQLQRFWNQEEIRVAPILSPAELECERHFVATHSRDASGRYLVRLPFDSNPKGQLGNSKDQALRILLGSERRQAKDLTLKTHYNQLLLEYFQLCRMESAPPLTTPTLGYYLHHHAVWKVNGDQKKIRVVFNASQGSSSGISLDDILLPGPKLQSDLWMTLTRWRLYRFAFSADIEKMFRQIRVHPDDRNWLRILWRQDPAEEMQEYRMTTVTYGTTSAPFLALRVLRQLAEDERERFPLGAQVLERHTYVDDILAGGDTLEQALEIRRQLVEILQSGGFPLDKWPANHPQLCPNSLLDSKMLQESEVHGALGLLWDVTSDSLTIRGPSLLSPTNQRWTKRIVISEIARLFDPLGWLSPVLVRAKILIQDLWLTGIDWDETTPESLTQSWLEFRGDLESLHNMKIPRWVFYDAAYADTTELHGFCDASERAFAATVYLRVRHPDGTVRTTLLVSKTRVAPLKPTSIPRLELCGALLLARLLSVLRPNQNFTHLKTFAWSDSTVVLSWIRAHASKWKTYVANRVAEIQDLVPDALWSHTRTSENPADLATRGKSADDLRHSTLWWRGPRWLYDPIVERPSDEIAVDAEDVPEKRLMVAATCCTSQEDQSYLSRFSSYQRLARVSAFLLRFLWNCRNHKDRKGGFLTSEELSTARTKLVRLSQRELFASELEAISKGESLKRSSSLIALKPFLDADGVLRVGGRLQNAPLPLESRHPMIVGRQSPLATLLIREAHLQTLHGGLNLTRCHLLQRFWIPRSRILVKKILHQCVRCARFKGTAGRQQMGNLPAVRLQPMRAFFRSGVDYAGPIQLRTSKGRGHKAYKAYIAVFICLSTKAVHLEAVSDLTTTSFLAAFRRFVSRRGHCAHMYSDNATNFRGADAELRTMFCAASRFYGEAAELLANLNTSRSFIPPQAPHFGGLWEAAVKSTKSHLRRTIGEQTLTFEEMSTLLTQIEACLNSRPLCPLSDDPEDLTPLTPGHFLIGEPLIALPEPPSSSSRVSAHSRWRLISKLRDDFWERWKREYLNNLMQLQKWRHPQDNINVGTLVLIKDTNLPPTKWPLARVTATHPGEDGLVRVVTVKTASRTYSRPVNKIIPLPVRAD